MTSPSTRSCTVFRGEETHVERVREVNGEADVEQDLGDADGDGVDYLSGDEDYVGREIHRPLPASRPPATTGSTPPPPADGVIERGKVVREREETMTGGARIREKIGIKTPNSSLLPSSTAPLASSVSGRASRCLHGSTPSAPLAVFLHRVVSVPTGVARCFHASLRSSGNRIRDGRARGRRRGEEADEAAAAAQSVQIWVFTPIMALSRRFLNLIVDNGFPGSKSLRCIDLMLQNFFNATPPNRNGSESKVVAADACI
uniref:Uncharacterized protein n=1 Tax=Oryza glumipatula TaxID=40148 RepID=A0A0D9ZSG1_9ORYZ